MKNYWNFSKNVFTQSEVSQQVEKLPLGVYDLHYNDMAGLFYLEKMSEKFSFPYKIYGNEEEWIKYTKKTWDNTNTNFGVILNGIKGTGKTVTSKLLCNKLELPVIIINKTFECSPISFLNKIEQDIVVFLDEYEKNYSEADHEFLTLMDGVMSNDYRRFFLLTTNDLYVNSNLLDRPSRIRYLKTFGDLNIKIINEIVDDLLKYPEFKTETIKFISSLGIITTDIVKTIVEEVNIHQVIPDIFKDFINAKPSGDIWDIYEINKNGGEKRVYEGVRARPCVFSENEIDNHLYINNKFIGRIKNFESERIVEVELISDNEINPRGKRKNKIVKYRIENGFKLHKSFLF